MKLKIDKTFKKDFTKARQPNLNKKLLAVLEEIELAKKLSDIANIKKLRGTADFYRIRLGDYRIGLIKEKNSITLIRFLHRKDIYKYFP